MEVTDDEDDGGRSPAKSLDFVPWSSRSNRVEIPESIAAHKQVPADVPVLLDESQDPKSKAGWLENQNKDIGEPDVEEIMPVDVVDPPTNNENTNPGSNMLETQEKTLQDTTNQENAPLQEKIALIESKDPKPEPSRSIPMEETIPSKNSQESNPGSNRLETREEALQDITNQENASNQEQISKPGPRRVDEQTKNTGKSIAEKTVPLKVSNAQSRSQCC